MNQFSESMSSLPTSPPASIMCKLIRSMGTKAFLKPDGAWTKDIRQAMHLPGFPALKAVTISLHLHEIEMYYSFDNDRVTQWDFALPLAALGATKTKE